MPIPPLVPSSFNTGLLYLWHATASMASERCAQFILDDNNSTMWGICTLKRGLNIHSKIRCKLQHHFYTNSRIVAWWKHMLQTYIEQNTLPQQRISSRCSQHTVAATSKSTHRDTNPFYVENLSTWEENHGPKPPKSYSTIIKYGYNKFFSREY